MSRLSSILVLASLLLLPLWRPFSTAQAEIKTAAELFPKSTIAYAELSALRGRIKGLLKGKVKLDSYSRAHLQETSARIGKVLEAKLELRAP